MSAKLRPSQPSPADRLYAALGDACMAIDPAERPTFTSILSRLQEIRASLSAQEQDAVMAQSLELLYSQEAAAAAREPAHIA
jgi:hypothetical protein